MNRPQVEQWIAALESGKYQQTLGVLRLGDQFCAIGVGCHASGLGAWIESGPHVRLYIAEADSQLMVMPDVVMAHYGITYEDHRAIHRLNDIDRKSFAEIAQYLRERLAQEEQQ